MRHDGDQQKLFTRRTALLAGGKLLLLSALTARMYYLQVLQADRYRTLADENRINLRTLLPPRGKIVDRFGMPLANNQDNYRVLLLSEQSPTIESTLDALGTIIEISDNDRKRIIREARRKRSWVPVTVRENLSWQEVARIEVNAPDLPGVLIDIKKSRNYPHGNVTAHVLGYVAAVNKKEANGDRLLLLPGFRIGKDGIEKTYDVALRGKGGSSQVEVNAFGRVIRELSRQEGLPGTELRLSLDLEVQKKAAESLPPESSAAVVFDIHTGAVLAIASTPSFDPNAFNRGMDRKEWQELSNNPMAPLINKATAGQYAPGSTFKLVVALAALESGIISPDTRFFCNGSLQLGNATFHCWKHDGHKHVSMRNGIKWSCDVYFYEIAKQIGIDRIGAMSQKLGLGQTLIPDLQGEQSGLIPTREWKQAVIGSSWQGGETLHMGIGQGYVLATPLQLAVMTARIANGGYAVMPRLIMKDISPDDRRTPKATKSPSLNLNPANLAVIQDAMNAVVNERGGTANSARINIAGMEMAGKTGTSQVRRIKKVERLAGVIRNRDLPWERRDHGLFVAYAPAAKPQYAISVVVEHGGSGSTTAAPVAREIMKLLQERHAPKTLAAPTARIRSSPLDANSNG